MKKKKISKKKKMSLGIWVRICLVSFGAALIARILLSGPGQRPLSPMEQGQLFAISAIQLISVLGLLICLILYLIQKSRDKGTKQ